MKRNISHAFKATGLVFALFFAATCCTYAQGPAKRTMKKKQDTETTQRPPVADTPTTPASTPVAGAKGNAPKTPATAPKQPTAAPKQPTTAPQTPTDNKQKPAGTPKRPSTRGAANAGTSGQTNFTREFPTAAAMPDDASWRRDVYRSLDLTKEENAVLYYPIVPNGNRQNLFVYLFRQILRGNINAYEYTLDANEHFDEEHQIKGKKIMDTHNIYYENNDGKIRVNDADLPSEDVKLYFIKESVYYDQHTASFRTKVTAICPVMVGGMGDFGDDESQRIPLFWVNYEQAAPYLAKLSLMGSSINNAAVVSADDYFTMNRYKGDIYKTNNLQDRIIAQYADTDSAQVAERKRIERELTAFEEKVWGHEPEKVLDAYGNPVLDSFGKPLTYQGEQGSEDRHIIDSKGRRVAFAVVTKDSVNIAAKEPILPYTTNIVLVNERGFAIDENGQPLLKKDGTPVEIVEEYPEDNTATDSKKSGKKTVSRRGTGTAAKSTKTTPTAKTTQKKSTAKAPKTKASKSASSGSKSGMSVRRERH